MQSARISLWIALAALAACSKSEPPPPAQKATPKAATSASPAPAAAPATSGDIDEGLKERLARQEAAAKMFESKVLSPPAPATPKPPADSRPSAPAASTAPQGAPPAAPPKVEPPRTEVAKAAPPKAEPPKAEPPKEAAKAAPAAPAPAPAPATRTDVAAAKPSSAVPEAPVTRLVSRVDPEYPREAASSGYESGYVKARMTLDAAGNVTRVEILAANPRRVFDRAVTRALSQWRYNEGAAGRTVDMEIDFKR